MTAQMQMSVRT